MYLGAQGSADAKAEGGSHKKEGAVGQWAWLYVEDLARRLASGLGHKVGSPGLEDQGTPGCHPVPPPWAWLTSLCEMTCTSHCPNPGSVVLSFSLSFSGHHLTWDASGASFFLGLLHSLTVLGRPIVSLVDR